MSDLRVLFIDDDFAESRPGAGRQKEFLREVLDGTEIQPSFMPYDEGQPAEKQISSACRRLAQEPFSDDAITDVVLLDVNFPKAGGGSAPSGLEVGLPLLREAHVPVIIRTSVQDMEAVVRVAREARGCEWVVKGPRPDDPSAEEKRRDLYYDDDLPDLIRRVVQETPRPRPLPTGVLVTHGTDTLSWGYSVLKYMLKGLDTNVVLTGSMEPLDKVAFANSDAIDNVKSSLQALASLAPPSISVVFGRGKNLFCQHIHKLNQTSPDAFRGVAFGTFEHDEIRLVDAKNRHPISAPIDRLFSIATGGTIDSKIEEGKGFVPTGNLVQAFIDAELGQYFKKMSTERIDPTVDSSNMHIDRWRNVAQLIDEKVTGRSESDLFGFDERVRVLYLSPFETRDDLLANLDADWSGFVLLGYGSGNGNIECCPHSELDLSRDGFLGRCAKAGESLLSGSPESFDPAPYFKGHPCRGFALEGDREVQSPEALTWCPQRNGGSHNVLDFVGAATALGRYVVLSSQVSLGPCDFEYETGLNLVRAGAIPGADLSVAEAQAKLAYILGHMEDVREAVARLEADGFQALASEHQIVTACMLAGVRFRSRQSNLRFHELTKRLGRPVYAMPENPLVFNSFSDGISAVVDFQKREHSVESD